MDLVTTYVEEIDIRYREAKRDRIHPRQDIAYQKWAANMNRAILNHITSGHEDAERLKYVHGYGLAKTQLLELHIKSRILKKGQKRRLREHIKGLRKIIFDREEAQWVSDFISSFQKSTD